MILDFNNGFFTLKNDTWLLNQRVAGKVLSSILSSVREKIKEGVSTYEIDKFCEGKILSNNCIPTFKGYKNFPAATCVSVNNEFVHGVPSKEVVLKNGDIVKIDLGVTYNDSIADSAITVVVGDYLNSKDRELVENGKRCLDEAILFINDNIDNLYLSDIGNFINKKANSFGLNIVKELTGHGLEKNLLHAYPIVLNYKYKQNFVKLLPRMCFCIEPVFIFGTDKYYTSDNGFTICGNVMCSHWEHTLFIHDDHVETITR